MHTLLRRIGTVTPPTWQHNFKIQTFHKSNINPLKPSSNFNTLLLQRSFFTYTPILYQKSDSLASNKNSKGTNLGLANIFHYWYSNRSFPDEETEEVVEEEEESYLDEQEEEEEGNLSHDIITISQSQKKKRQK